MPLELGSEHPENGGSGRTECNSSSRQFCGDLSSGGGGEYLGEDLVSRVSGPFYLIRLVVAGRVIPVTSPPIYPILGMLLSSS